MIAQLAEPTNQPDPLWPVMVAPDKALSMD